MQFHNLKRKTKNKKARQHGRGGKRGKTAGRGTKGQNARAGRKKRPELRDTIKRLPKLRGRGVSSLKSLKKKAQGAELKALLENKKSKRKEKVVAKD
jgi:large subunit ribosomal protein L15